MMAMLHSLRVRLLLALVLIALMPVGVVAVLIDHATTRAFSQYSSERSVADAQTVALQTSELTGKNAIVYGAGNTVLAVAGAAGGNSGSVWGEAPGGGGATAPLAGNSSAGESGSLTGGVTAGDGVFVSLPNATDRHFLGDVARALLIAVGVAAAGAMVLAWLLARQIVKPVESLTFAAEAMAAGDLGRRVTAPARDEIGVLARAFNTMADSRARLDGLRRNLVNDVAHELRTPLANLQGYLEVLRDGVTAPTPAVLAVLHEESLLLNRLVADLQELALAEAGQLPLVKEPVDIGELVAHVIDALRLQADAKNVTLVSDAAGMIPMAFVDADRVSQVLRNLLRNAIAHTPPGGTAAVAAMVQGDDIEVTVRDTGAGIAPEHLPYVFDRFYRADPARARATGGAGLGLAIVKHLVEAHGGAITVASTPGRGAVFTFTLPLAPQLAAA
jgi:signal transduction histidine kinase